MTRIIVDKRTDNALIIFDLFFYYSINVKENVFFFASPRSWLKAKTEQASSISFSQSDWFIPQHERFWLAITEKTAPTRILNQAKRRTVN